MSQSWLCVFDDIILRVRSCGANLGTWVLLRPGDFVACGTLTIVDGIEIIVFQGTRPPRVSVDHRYKDEQPRILLLLVLSHCYLSGCLY